MFTDVCSVEEDTICLKVVTGESSNNQGYLTVAIDLVEVASGYFDQGETVIDDCFSAGNVSVMNTNTDGWVGSVSASIDGGATYEYMYCSECAGAQITSFISVDGNDDGWGTSRCLNGASCGLTVVGENGCTQPYIDWPKYAVHGYVFNTLFQNIYT
jgi:hypothetical protein